MRGGLKIECSACRVVVDASEERSSEGPNHGRARRPVGAVELQLVRTTRTDVGLRASCAHPSISAGGELVRQGARIITSLSTASVAAPAANAKVN